MNVHVLILFAKLFIAINNHFINKHDNMVCLLNSCLYVMFRSCFESLASVVPIKLVRAAHCAASRCAPRIAAHRTYMGSCGEKNDWQFYNPRIDTGPRQCF